MPNLATPEALDRLSDIGEHAVVAYISQHLATFEDKEWLGARGKDIADVLNGRVGDPDGESDRMMERWNRRLGYHYFGFDCSRRGQPL